MKQFILGISFVFYVLVACGDDDDSVAPPPLRDRAEQAVTDDSLLQDYLKTHYFELKEANEEGVKIVDRLLIKKKDSADIADNTGPISLWDSEQLVTKKITSNDVEQKFYVLQLEKGAKGVSTFVDSTFVTYRGQLLNGDVFDSSPNPVWFDLVSVVEGFRQGIAGYGGASEIAVAADGTFNVSDDYGIGAVFMPSGLGYFNNGTPGAAYANLVFTFQIFSVNQADHDRDNVPSIVENLNGNTNILDDDTDENGTPNFADSDDDGDGIATINEDLEPDTDVTVDRDGDGDPTNDIGDGDPTNDDTDNDGIPNYLDPDSTQSRLD